MSTKKVSTRIQNKYDLKENWARATTFVPLQGELITIAPKTRNSDDDTTTESDAVFSTIPHRIKIGDGVHKLSELPYIGVPIVKQAQNSTTAITTLTGFNSVIMVPKNRVNLQLDLRGKDFCSLANFETYEFIHHKIITPANTAASDNNTINFIINCDSANNIQLGSVYFAPDKCLLSSWSTANTVTSNKYTKPKISRTDSTDENNIHYIENLIEYTLSKPTDINTEGAFQIDISGYLSNKTGSSATLNLFIENKYFAPCFGALT